MLKNEKTSNPVTQTESENNKYFLMKANTKTWKQKN